MTPETGIYRTAEVSPPKQRTGKTFRQVMPSRKLRTAPSGRTGYYNDGWRGRLGQLTCPTAS
eukprot:354470-Chlamydomonas_euryale.AAC.23